MKRSLAIFGFLLALVAPAAFGQVMSGSNPNPACTNLQLWLEAGAGVSTGSGTSVIAWTNQATSTIAVTNATTNALPAQISPPSYVGVSTFLNGQPAIAFSTNSGLNIPNASTMMNGAYTIFAVVAVTNFQNTSATYALPLLGNNNVNMIYVRAGSGSSTATLNVQANNGTAIQSTNTFAVNTSNILSVTSSGSGSGNTKLYIQGVQGDNAQSEVAFPTVATWNLGWQTNTTITRFFNGHVAEILVYQGVLSLTDQAKITAYLGAKYNVAGIQGVMIGSIPNPAYTNLQLWLEAGAGVSTGSGTSVIAWANQATSTSAVTNATTNALPAQINAPNFVSASTFLNGQPAIAFGTNSGLNIANTSTMMNSNYTVLAVIAVTNFQNSSATYALPLLGNNNANMFYVRAGSGSSTATFNVQANNGTAIQSTTTFTVNSSNILSATSSGPVAGNTELYIQGTHGDNGQAEAAFPTLATWNLGWQTNTTITRFFNGHIAEVLVYQGVLSAVDLAKATSYLGTKYGLAVPPIPVATPMFNPSSGNYIGAQSVTITSDSGSTIFYTTNGTTPTSTSPSGTSPIVVNVPINVTGFAIAAYATNTGFANSAVVTNTYTTATVTTVSQVQTLGNGKRVLYVDGQPFQAYGGQMRVDTWRDYAGYNNQQMAALQIFGWPSNLSMNVVQVPILWKDCEPTQNSFNWTNLQWAIGQCVTNGLRMEILWYGLNVGGGGWSGFLPSYVISNTNTYPLLVNSNGVMVGQGYSNGDGYRWTLSPEYAATIAVETNVLSNLMWYLRLNDTNHVVIGIQIENEPSIVQGGKPTPYQTDRDYSAAATALYNADGYTNALNFTKDRLAIYHNKIAAAVKTSPYQIWTRVNWVAGYWNFDEDVGRVLTLGTNVDFVAWDPYGWSPLARYSRLTGDLSPTNASNIPFVSEEPGNQDATCFQKIFDLLAANGDGCEFYRVDTYTNTSSVDNYLIKTDGTDARTWTDSIRQSFGMLQKVMSQIAVLQYTNNASSPIQYFNSVGNTATFYTGTNMLNGMSIQYGTSTGGVGIAFAAGNDTVLMSAKAGTFTLNTEPGVFENGYYDTNGNWVAVSVHAATYNTNETTTINLSPSTPYEVVKFRLAQHLAITSINGGANPTAGAAFSVVVQAQDTNGAALNLTNSTVVTLSLKNGSGILGGTLTGTISSGSNSTTISGVTYSKAESGIVITATETSGQSLVSGDSTGLTVNPNAAAALTLLSGNNQSSFVGQSLIAPCIVVVTDTNGNPVSASGLTVTFAIASMPSGATGQSLSATTVTTDASGQAASTLTLGNTLGTYTVTATSVTLSNSPIIFTATAVTPFVKASTGTDLTAGASWTGGVVPASANTAYWTNTSLGSGLTMGSSESWGGVSVSSGLTDIGIAGVGPLTLGSSGIDMSASTVNMSLGVPDVIGASQTWNVNAGVTLSVSETISGGFGITKAGAGTLSLSGINTYSGPTIIGSGTLALVSQPIAGSSLWLDGTRGVTNSGGSVTGWADQSGNGLNAIPGTAPTVGSINGLQAISFDGMSQGLNIATSGLLTGASESVFVMSQNVNATNGVAMLLCEAINTNAAAGVTFFENGSPPALELQKNQANFDTIKSAATFSFGLTLTEMVLSGTNAAQTQLFINGNLDSATNAISALSAGDHVNIGYQYDYSTAKRWFQGQIGEILVYPSALSASDRQTVESYLNNKWLGSGSFSILSPNTSVQIAAGATFDVSGLGASATYNFGSSAGLTASGTGTVVGTSAAAIKGGSNGIVNLGSRPVTLTYDGSHPALLISQGTLSLNGNPFIINTASPLATGTYTVVQQASGAIITNGSFSVSGTAIDSSHSGSIQVVGTNVNLSIVQPPGMHLIIQPVVTAPSITGYSMLSGGSFQLNFTGTQGQPFRVLGTNLLSAPLATWPVLTNGTFGVGGTVTFTDPSTSATNTQKFYRIVSP